MLQIDTDLTMALTLNDSELSKSQSLKVGYDFITHLWEIIVRYHGDLIKIADTINAPTPEILTEQYAIMQLTAAQIDSLLQFSEIEYMEKPKGLLLNANAPLYDACIEPVRSLPEINLTGQGVLIAILDSGIDYQHPDFISETGESRIIALWDQTGGSTPPPIGFQFGSLYTQSMITAALTDSSLVPSKDLIGHGTHVAGIAAGNGRASNGEHIGVAPEAELVIVKLADSDGYGFSKTTSLMRGIQFAIQTAISLNRPLVINMSLGTNDGGHDGFSLFETYIDDMTNRWLTSIVIAAGNQGNARFHAAPILKSNSTQSVEFHISPLQASLSLQLWKNFTDELFIEIIAPDGSSTGPILKSSNVHHTTIMNSELTIYYSPPSPYTPSSSILIELTGSPLNSGIWSLILSSGAIVDGTCNIWMTTTETTRGQTFFLVPSESVTITMPATALRPIAVAAYNSSNGAIASFSGRGYTRTNTSIKPDLAAPGVDIISCWPGGGYQSLSGTSMAAPFVCGCAALLMQWGIVNGNDPFLYGQKLKAYLQKGARRTSARSYPNVDFGYGTLCFSDSLEAAISESDSFPFNINANAQDSDDCFNIRNSENYLDIITSEYFDARFENQCRIPLGTGQYLNFYALSRGSQPEDVYSYFNYSQLPIIYGLAQNFSNQIALEATGIAAVTRRPLNPLSGSGVLIAIIDSGINYTHPAFRRADGTTIIESVWDQVSNQVYSRSEIQEALTSGTLLPITDPVGHGTYIAGIAAGQPDPSNDFFGAAYGSNLVCIKLRPAKSNLRSFYGISNDVPAYSSTDVILAIQYALEKAGELDRPLVILLALSTNLGGHDGSDPVELYLGRLANAPGIAIVTASGNETGYGKHYTGTLTTETIVEFFVAENETSVLLNIWGQDPDIFTLSLESPTGNNVERLPRSATRLNSYRLSGETSLVSIRYYGQGAPCSYVRLDFPSSGIWRLHIYGDTIINGLLDIWLPIQNFSQPETRFLQPSPNGTVTVPSTQPRVITVGGYRPLTNSIYENSGRGPTRNGFLRPSIVAPSNNVYGPAGNSYRSIPGTSTAAALTAGAAAQFLQYGIVQGNDLEMNTLSIQSQLTRCAARNPDRTYPNNSWGYGSLSVNSCI